MVAVTGRGGAPNAVYQYKSTRARTESNFLEATHLGLLSLLRFVQRTSSLLAQKKLLLQTCTDDDGNGIGEHRIRGTTANTCSIGFI